MGGGKQQKRHKGLKRRLTLMCGLPSDVLGGGARVTLFAKESVMIEGQQGMVELGTERMRLRTRSGILTVLGEGLALRELTMDAAMIAGMRIDAVFYGRGGDGAKGGAPWL